MNINHGDDDADLRARFGDAMREIGQTERHIHERGRTTDSRPKRSNRGMGRLRVGALLVGALALGAVPAYAAGRGSAPVIPHTAQSASPGTSDTLAAPQVVQRAISWALSARDVVQSVTKIQVKLVTFADFYSTWSDYPGACSQPLDPHTVKSTMYVVAMSGNFLMPSVMPHPVATIPANPVPASAGSKYVVTHWAAVFIPTDPDGVPEAAPRFAVANVDMHGNWPPCFDKLTNVAH